MARKFNVFTGLDRRLGGRKNKTVPVVHDSTEDRITPEQIKDIVSREVNAASARSQMMNYFDSMAASSQRTESMLVELRDALDAGLARIGEATGRNDDGERLEQIDASVRQVLEASDNLSESIGAIGESLGTIGDTVKEACETGAGESLRHMESTYGELEASFDELKATLHRDNLITYKNIRQAIEESENKAIARENGLRKGIMISLIANGILFVAVVVLILVNLGII